MLVNACDAADEGERGLRFSRILPLRGCGSGSTNSSLNFSIWDSMFCGVGSGMGWCWEMFVGRSE